MYEIVKAASKFHDEMLKEGFTGDTAAEFTHEFFRQLLVDSPILKEAVEPEGEDEDEEDNDRTLGTYYVNIEPRVDKVREVLEEIAQIDTTKIKSN